MVGDRGVDVVLNSLTSGDYIGKTVGLLAKGGRWIEIGKRNIWSHERMAAERPDVQYETHSLNELLPAEPERLRPMLERLATNVAAGECQPLPTKVFEMRGELVDAFRHLQSGSAIGKVVVRVDPPPEASAVADGKGCVLVTGGLGGLGLVTADALVAAGARCVVLASRSGKIKHTGQGLEERLVQLQTAMPGVEVMVERCDTSDEDQVAAMLDRVRQQHGPLRAIVHAAGVVLEMPRHQHDADWMRRVWGPKADGAWFLHKHTVGVDDVKLRSFVLFSSEAALFGNAGQANYSAANGYLDGLARWRVSQGLPGVSVQWPAVSGVGMASSLAGVAAVSVGPNVVRQVLLSCLSDDGGSTIVQPVLPDNYLHLIMSIRQLSHLFSDLPGRRRSTGPRSRNSARQRRSHHDVVARSRWHGMTAGAIHQQITAQVTAAVQDLLGAEEV